MQREETLTPPNHSEAQEIATQSLSLDVLCGKPRFSFLIYQHVCENTSTLQPAQGLNEALLLLLLLGVMPGATDVLSKVAPFSTITLCLQVSEPCEYLQNEEVTLFFFQISFIFLHLLWLLFEHVGILHSHSHLAHPICP